MAAAQVAGLSLDLSGLEAIKSLAKQRAITLKAVKAGAKLVQAAAKSRAPKRSGALKQSIGTKSVRGKKGKTLAYAVVGARKKVEKTVKRKGRKPYVAKPSKYIQLVERGTKTAKAKPFLRPAFDSTKQQALEAAQQTFAAELEKAIAAQAAKLAK